jgi:2-polyprenyl-6-methoxyphenol hydroxylase-like FAD-dependent oxidoreductase
MIDVLIVGAGPTGLTLAILCHRLGLSYRIIDQNSGWANESRALGIQARTLEIFDKLGIIDEFMKKGMKAKGAKLFLKGRKRLEIDTLDMARKDTKFPYIFFLPQSETEKILLKEVSVERNAKLQSFRDKKDRVTASIINSNGDREQIECRYLCGCDGSHSEVRKILGLDFMGDAYAAEFLMADCKVDWKEDFTTVKVFLESGKLGVFFPIRHSSLCRVLTVSQLAREGAPITESTTSYPASLNELEKEFRKASHMDVKFSEPKWVTRYHVHHRCVSRMREGNVFVLGDAAHIHSPVGAQGMNTGIQDANNLAWKLKAAIASPETAQELLETYNSERLPVAKHLINFTDKVFTAAVSKNPWFLRVRNLVIPLLGKTLTSFHQGRQRLFKFVSQLNIHYHSNFVTKVTSGERAPNGRISENLWLHDLLKGYEFNVLAFKKDPFTHGEVTSVHLLMNDLGIKNVNFLRMVDPDDGFSMKVPLEIFHSYSIDEQGLYIIRPDGYIGDFMSEFGVKSEFPVFYKEFASPMHSYKYYL